MAKLTRQDIVKQIRDKKRILYDRQAKNKKPETQEPPKDNQGNTQPKPGLK